MMKIAIDGPAGAGKSATAKAVAKELGFIYVDTGALYRGIGLYVIRKGAKASSIEEVVPLLAEIKIEMKHIENEQHIFLNGEDVSGLIRTESVSAAASDVSAIPAVRDFLFDMQRDIAEKNDVIMDGRDIGTVVLPDAELKIFLTAKPEVRAERRVKQLLEKGIEANFDDVLADVIQRDYNDSHRDFRPLKLAEDGILLDNSELSFEETFEKIISLAKERMA
ncbi:MAG: (d)CMP kinase [Oscillospiraceae bacterium]|nr:(d)CMP kinase [Oscillospiraceae bacterium]MBP1575283.1 (d)CMP kinase [Oscillospiraceae bacterium]